MPRNYTTLVKFKRDEASAGIIWAFDIRVGYILFLILIEVQSYKMK